MSETEKLIKNIYNLPTDDEETWNTICNGNVIGIFQLGILGIHWSKQLKPRNIRQLSDLISCIRPGMLDLKIDGKSATERFCNRKNGIEEIKFLHPSLEHILKDSQGFICYQEDSIRLANEIAGFTPVESDLLRKAIGTKDVEIMSNLEKTFVEGCERTGKVDNETAKQLFEEIRKSQKYSFNLSHSISYSTISYWDAYCKTHYPLDFYCEKLNQCHHKPKPKKAINQLVRDAQRNGFFIRSPKLEDVLEDDTFGFYHKDDEIIFGINHIQGIGESKIVKIHDKLNSIRSWMDALHSGIDKTTFVNLLSIGFFDFGKTRKEKIFEYNLFNKLSKREQNIVKDEKIDNVKESFHYLLNQVNVRRKEIIKSLILTINEPPYSLEDDPLWINEIEVTLMGISLSYHKTETEISHADTTCKEINDGKTTNSVVFVEIDDPKEYTINKGKLRGQKMGSFSGSDHSGTCKFLIFGDTWVKYQSLLYDGALVTLVGNKSKDAFIINVVK